MPDRASPPPLRFESLERREVPAASPWLAEAFQQPADTGLPGGWTQWNSDDRTGFRVDKAAGLGDQGRLTSEGISSAASRAWLSAPFAADVQASAAVFLNNPVPLHLFVRGKGLDTDTPSYYAATVSRGTEVALVKVSGGRTSVLGGARTADWTSNRWATLTVRAEGDTLRAFLHRGDTNQYLAPDGTWTQTPTAAVEAADEDVRTGGQVGFARPPGGGDPVRADSLRVTAPQPPSGPAAEERFDAAAAPGLPAGWTEWTSGPAGFATTPGQTLRVDAGSAADARAWLAAPTGADVQVSASVFVDGLTPAGLFARGQQVDTDRPSFYALTVGRGLDVRLVRVTDGVTEELGRLKTREYAAGLWVQASLVASGDQLRVQVFRSDTGQYLLDDGTWGLAPGWAMTRTDAALPAGGVVGLHRGAGYAGPLVFDNFVVTTTPAPAPAAPVPTEDDKPPAVPLPDPDLPGATPAPVPVPTTPAPTAAGLPPVARNYPHIRLANLAYWGTPLDDAATQSLLRHSVDLVVPNLAYLPAVEATNPATPQFVYTNVSNLYLGLLTDWNAYADRRGLSREGAFLHVTKPTGFSGMSASAVPVDRFWGVYRSAGGEWANLTRDARNTGNDLQFAEAGEAVALGFLERFREINIDLKSRATDGWAAALEYVSKVDAAGAPLEWKPLRTLSDTTNKLTKTGRLQFDPPADWQAASVGGSARLFYVRFRTTQGGIAPEANRVLGRDYTAGGVIPAFDSAADRNNDGYLSDAEYSKRAEGMDARFRYESRLTYPQYGPMRFATNVGNAGFRAWAADYHARFLRDQPLADGFFVDNSSGRLAVDPDGLAESVADYAADYGSLLGGINASLLTQGKWLIANTAGGNQSAEPVAAAGVSTLEEFALRPLAANHVQFDDLQATLAYRRQLSGGTAYEILDSLPTGGVDASDPRLQLATLAMYYTVADPAVSMLMVNGGNEPASSWDRHFIPASTVDVGQPAGAAAVWATGGDPTNADLTYKVYGREYANALVLYKPLSYTRGESGTTADETATTHELGGLYRPVAADGGIGPATRRVTLRNGEGAVLLRV